MLKILLRLCFVIGLCYATPNCHELQKSQLAALNDRITHMLNSLYPAPLAPKSEPSKAESSSLDDTPANEYASSPEPTYYTYPPFAVPQPQVIYVTPSHLPSTYRPSVYSPQPTFAPSPVTYSPPPVPYAPYPPPGNLIPPCIRAIPPVTPAPAMYVPPPVMPTPPPPNMTPTPSPFYHLESKGQPFDPYGVVPRSPLPHYESYHYSPLPYPSTPSTPHSPSYPPTYPYSPDYSPSYPEHSAPLQYPPKLTTYSPPPPAYLPPQGYQPPAYHSTIPYPSFYPRPNELAPPPYYA